ncbi:hypothetical protein BIW11_06346 [Tropilaelaps mercedesae]|uniref:Uncharacterized protein n=1 Tax=Tropilaelaps mercedesae TaxID=418985 RepID=A0A1V9XYJ0_9ACAR|nr:hypothetical protein BIW11_06346 [Tropilaelaps mercedesae]
MRSCILVALLLLSVCVLTSAQEAQLTRRSTSTDHLDRLSRDELLDILGRLEGSASRKNEPAKYPYSRRSTYTSVRAPPRTNYSTSSPSTLLRSTTRRPVPSSSGIDDLIQKYKTQKGQPSSPTVDLSLRRLENNGRLAPSTPSSRFNYAGSNYASNSRYASATSSYGSWMSSGRSSSLPYPTSYNSALYPTREPTYPPYPSSADSSYPTSYGSSGHSPLSQPSYGSRGSSLYNGSSYPKHSGGYSPSGTFGGAAPKYVTTTKKPKKGFLSKIFG